MKKTFILLLLCMATALLMTSCKKNADSTATPSIVNKLADNASIVDTTTIVSVDSLSVTVKKDTVTHIVGDVLLAAPTTTNPHGFLRKITAVANNGGTVKYTTEQSTLNDAFKQLNIDYVNKDSYNKIAVFGAGGSDGGSLFDFSFKANSTICPGITIDGELKVNRSATRFNYEKAEGSLLPSLVHLEADINTNGSSLSFKSNSTSSATLLSAFTMAKVVAPPIEIPIPVGPIVIPVVITQTFTVTTMPITISGKAKWSHLPVLTATVGAEYNNGNWTNLSSFTDQSTSPALSAADFIPKVSVTANATLLKFEYELAPYGLDYLTSSFSVAATSSLTVQTASPNYSIKVAEDIEGSIKQKFWLGTNSEYSISIPVAEKTILEGNFLTYKLLKASGDAQTDSSGSVLKKAITVQVVDSVTGFAQQGVQVTFTVGTGSGSIVGATGVTTYTAFTDANGFATLQWQLGTDSAETLTATVIGFFKSSKVDFSATALSNGLKIGGSYAGGIVFYIDATGKHGLVCATTDQSTGAVWDASSNATSNNYNPTPTGATGTAIGTGAANTTQIIAVLGSNGVAASLCRNYRGGGYADWFLPSEDELNKLYKNSAVVGGLATYYYWSSSEGVGSGLTYAWYQYCGLGGQTTNGKYGTFHVRAVRAF